MVSAVLHFTKQTRRINLTSPGLLSRRVPENQPVLPRGRETLVRLFLRVCLEQAVLTRQALLTREFWQISFKRDFRWEIGEQEPAQQYVPSALPISVLPDMRIGPR